MYDPSTKLRSSLCYCFLMHHALALVYLAVSHRSLARNLEELEEVAYAVAVPLCCSVSLLI
jgi:hypothetical protein